MALFQSGARPHLRCDVAVVGAGPAGAAAATHLARCGVKVLLLDQKTFPRDKVCGDFVGPAALRELEQIGVTRVAGWQSTSVARGAALFIGGDRILNRRMPFAPGFPEFGRVIPRVKLDAWICDAARDAGARVLEGHRVLDYRVNSDGVSLRARGKTGDETVRAKLLIGADGSSSVVARALNRGATPAADRIIAVRAYFEGVSGPSDELGLYFDSASFPGYCWIFPTGRRTANVGVGMILETVPPSTSHLRALLMDLVERDPALRRRLGRARLTGKIVGWPLETYNPRRPLVGDRVMLVGDAAGLINPLNGEGIQYALQSGRWAAEVAVRCARAGDLSRSALAVYSERVVQELRTDMESARLLVSLIRNRTLGPVWLWGMRMIAEHSMKDAEFSNLIGGVLAGVVPTQRAISLTLLRRAVWQGTAVVEAGMADGLRRGGLPLAHESARFVRRAGSMVSEVARDPDSHTLWFRDVVAAAVELRNHARVRVRR